MPRLNAAGQWTTGYGRSWFDDRRTIRQDCSTGACVIRLDDGELVSSRGNLMHVEGRDGRWAAQDAAGVYGSWGEIPGAALMGGPAPYAAQLIGPDGSLIYKAVYQSYGPWRLRYIDGRDEEFIPGDGWAFQNLGGGKAVWLDTKNALHGRGVTVPPVTCYGIRWVDGHLLRQDAITNALVLDEHVVAPAAGYHRPDLMIRPDGSFLLVWSPDAGEGQGRSLILTPAQLAALPVVEAAAPPPPPAPATYRTIGPLTLPRSADGRLYDLTRFIVGDAALWPRSGPGHPMNQVMGGGGIFHYVKFANPSTYETWAFDENWIYHLEDASPAEPYSFADPRWFPRSMPIGESHAFASGEHRTIFRERGTCRVVRDEPFWRRMWLHAVYDEYYWGPDLGVRATIVIAYDPTAGVHIKERGVELGYYALGAGSVRWEYYPADTVYPPGVAGAHFSQFARTAQSDFYLLGGPNTQPQLTGCVPLVVPSYPPWIDIEQPEEQPMSQGPTLHVWTIDEFPQVVHARQAFLNDPTWQPDPAWVILQMARRYGFGLPPGESPWMLQAMINHELNPEGD